MTRRWWWLSVVAATALAVVVAMAWAAPVAVGLPALLTTLLAGRAALADRQPPAPPGPAEPMPIRRTPAERIDATLSWGYGSARLFDRSARPLLQRALRAALAGRGVDLDRDSGQVRRLLGEPAWYLLDPGRAPRDDSNAAGISRPDLQQLVSLIEELNR